MASEELVIIDTCIWVPFFNSPTSAEKRVVDDLLDSDRAAIVGPVAAEILMGFKRDEHAAWVASFLAGLHRFEPSWEEWCAAASLGRTLAARRHRLPLTDLVVAACAMRHNTSVFTTDPHFDLIPGLRRFQG